MIDLQTDLKTDLQTDLRTNLKIVKEDVLSQLASEEVSCGEILFNNHECQILSQSAVSVDFLVNTTREDESVEYSLYIRKDDNSTYSLTPIVNKKPVDWDRFSYACLLQYEQELSLLDPKAKPEHMQYTRQGMIKRVLDERRQKAEKAVYRMDWADNIYGDHMLTNEFGTRYRIFLRDFKAKTGYSDSWDARTNKLGTTKHIIFAFDELKKTPKLFARMDKTYPFIEVYCDPLKDYRITWFYPHELSVAEQLLISRYFKKQGYIENTEPAIKSFLGFIEQAEEFERICIRPEVRERVGSVFEQSMLKELKRTQEPDYSSVKAKLFPYQKEGVEFVLFKKVALIADEMGLGKTLQAIAAAVLKKQAFGFTKTLVVCPATLKSQWKKEIERFTGEKARIIQGRPEEREAQYLDDSCYFLIVNYETILRDSLAINNAGIDFLILDEAQRIKNYETRTSSSIKRLQPKHTLVITGTPIENRLIDIYSIVSALDPYFFGPLWEFSYQHCLFDPEKTNKINGYYNLQALNEKLKAILIRREKRDVLDQMPQVQQIDIPVKLSPLQAEYHASYAKGVSKIIRKKFLTAYDLQRLQLLLCNMRMVCDSTYLIDEKTNESPKMEELKHILIDELDLKNTDRKIIIFSEWVKVHKLIGQMLRKNGIGFVELSGKVPVKARGDLIKKFENSPQCKVFLSTEAGGAGLNLQVASLLINFELPWNPAKKNQRIGRIDRLGQRSSNLTIYNLITLDSIEQQIAAGLLVKQNLFESVLDDSSTTDFVDFSSKGRSQFIEQLEAFIKASESKAVADETPLGPPPPDEAIEHDDELDEDIELVSFPEEDADKPEQEVPAKETPDEHEPGLIKGETAAAEFEQVMASGMQFLAGLFKMSTGKDLGLTGNQIAFNKETGEVTMTFKLPV